MTNTRFSAASILRSVSTFCVDFGNSAAIAVTPSISIDATAVNVNTAPAEVISALMENFSVSQANALIERRKQAYYRQKSDFQQQLFGGQPPADPMFDVKSEYFLVLSRVRLDRAALDAEALVNRKLDDQTFKTTTVWVRQN